ncbi:MAG: hypothetical protein ACRDJC_12895 [Thermomicrobiales bacterium]
MMHRLDRDDLPRPLGEAAPRRVAMGRLSAVVLGMLSAFGLQPSAAGPGHRASGGKNRNKRRRQKRASGPSWTITRAEGEQFTVMPGAFGSACTSCPGNSVAIGGGVLSFDEECHISSSVRGTQAQWCIEMRCPADAGSQNTFIPEVICIS